jgi:hypothetical protein
VCTNPTKQVCGRCSITAYCSDTCQKIGWRAGHREECPAVGELQISGKKGPITSREQRSRDNQTIFMPKTTEVVFIQEDKGVGRIKTKYDEKGVAYIKFNQDKTSALQLIVALEKIAEEEGQLVPERLTSKQIKMLKAARKEAKKAKKAAKKAKKAAKKAAKSAESRSRSPKRKSSSSSSSSSSAEEEAAPENPVYKALFEASGGGSAEESAAEEEYDVEEWVNGEDGMSVNDIETELSTAVAVFMAEEGVSAAVVPSSDRLDSLEAAFRVRLSNSDEVLDPTTNDYLGRYEGKRNLVRDAIERFFSVTEEDVSAAGPGPGETALELGELREFMNTQLESYLDRQRPRVSDHMTPVVYLALVQEYEDSLRMSMAGEQVALLKMHPALVEETLAAHGIGPSREVEPIAEIAMIDIPGEGLMPRSELITMLVEEWINPTLAWLYQIEAESEKEWITAEKRERIRTRFLERFKKQKKMQIPERYWIAMVASGEELTNFFDDAWTQTWKDIPPYVK